MKEPIAARALLARLIRAAAKKALVVAPPIAVKLARPAAIQTAAAKLPPLAARPSHPTINSG